MSNNMKTVESKLYAALGNGKNAAMHLNTLVQDAAVSGDATFVCRAIVRAQQKGDEQAANLFKRVLQAVFPAGKIATKENNVTFARNKCEAEPSVLAALELAALNDLSIRGAAFRKAVFGAPVSKTSEEKFAAAVRAAIKGGLSVDDMALIIQNEVSAAKAA